MPSTSDAFQILWRSLLRLRNSEEKPLFDPKKVLLSFLKRRKAFDESDSGPRMERVYATFVTNGYFNNLRSRRAPAAVPFSAITMTLEEAMGGGDFSVPSLPPPDTPERLFD